MRHYNRITRIAISKLMYTDYEDWEYSANKLNKHKKRSYSGWLTPVEHKHLVRLGFNRSREYEYLENNKIKTGKMNPSWYTYEASEELIRFIRSVFKMEIKEYNEDHN